MDWFKDWLTVNIQPPEQRIEKSEKELYLLAGDTLVKIKLTAELDRANGRAGLSCAISEIDGEAVSEERAAKIEMFGEPPSAEAQKALVREALAKWRIARPPSKVSDEYVRMHLKISRLKRANKNKKGGNVDVYS